jgi:4-aminobutyrate aminotransferase
LAPEKMQSVIFECLRRGVIIVPCGRYGNVIRVMPSLTVPRAYLFAALDILVAALRAL